MELIGVKANKECPLKYSRVLKKEVTYHFTRWYKVEDSDDSITVVDDPLSDLYNLDKLQINVSAIAGKNGVGKSTLLELVYLIINNLSALEPSLKHPLTLVKDLSATLYFKTDRIYRIKVQNEKVIVNGYSDELKLIKRPIGFDFSRFFYSLITNYSQYALNSKDQGVWLKGLFHKNDGYQVPLVINPMRINGNIDINTENQLAKARFLTNLLRPAVSNRYISENLEVKFVSLGINSKNRNKEVLYSLEKGKEKNGEFTREEIKLIDLDLKENQLLEKLNEVYDFGLSEIKHEYENQEEEDIDEFVKSSLDYLFYKLASISLTYPDYAKFFDKENRTFYSETFQVYLEELISKDTSHKAFKLKQTLNFLKFRHIPRNYKKLTLDNLSERIEKVLSVNNFPEERRIELLPPPIFKFDLHLEFSGKDGKKELVDFGELSSGEKQLIYSTNSVVYHLNNIDSVTTGHQYENVNVMLDEIELYFHPEYQRKFISYLRDQISYSTFKRIRSLNFCFITHSPFILSDIPASNILFLTVDSDNKAKQVEIGSETFCANIHELLAHGFFMNDGLIGAYAVKKVKEVIAVIEGEINGPDVNWNRRKLKSFIKRIGEPLLKEKLLELYEEKFAEENLDRKIARLEKELANAKKRKGSFDKD